MRLPLDDEDATFADGDWSAERLERRSFVGCRFERCRFGEARLDRWTLDDCTFVGCDLAVVRWGDTTLRDVHFVDCKLTGVDWAAAHDLTLSVRFTRCTLDYGSFIRLPLKGLRVDDSTGRDVQFADCDLQGARFDRVKLDGASFLRCDLRRASFAGSSGVALDPTCRLGKTTLGMDDALAHLHRLGIAVGA